MTNVITGDQMAMAVGRDTTQELREAFEKIKHCVSQLSDEQVWWRASESQNSIGNLILHLCGNLRQWIVAGVGGTNDVRDRPQEFSERSLIPKSRLLSQLEAVVADASQALAALTAEELLRVRRIQGFEVTGLGAIFHSVPHFRGHAQEIVYRTRLFLGDDYKFAWNPQNPGQGTP